MTDRKPLAGKVALITGAARGIGLAAVTRLAADGADIVAFDLPGTSLHDAVKAAEAAGRRAVTFEGDVTVADDWKRVVRLALQSFERIDILFNNAGISGQLRGMLEYPDDDFDRVMAVNVRGAWLAMKHAMPVLRARGGGSIVNTSSVAGLAGNPPGMSTIAYNTSKGADINFTRALAAEWGKYNINVNAICPGFFPSKMSQGLLDKLGKSIIAMTPLQRIGGDEDLMGTAVFLASEASRHVTGQYLTVDGGASCC